MSQSIGEQLRLARGARQITLEQAAKATHIRQRFLEALENEQWEILPSKVQGRGFLRLYAEYLGLNVEKMLNPTPKTPAPEVPLMIEQAPAAIEEPAPLTEIETSATIPAAVKEQTVFEEIGQLLRQRREGISLSLGDVERYTRLRARYLQALEEGRIDEMPSPVQGRGMLSNYATFLGLDGDTILNRYAEGLQNRLAQSRPIPAQPDKSRPQPKARSGWRRLVSFESLIGGSLLIGLIFLAVWGSAQIAAVQNANEPTLPSVSDAFRETRTLEAQNGSTATGIPQATAQVQATATIPIVGNDPLQVYVIAQQRAWMQVIEDGKIVFSGRIVPNTAYPFSAITQLEVYTGSAPAIRIYFNQAEYPLSGRLGEPLRLIFTAQGVITPTPLFTATPTATPQPTATLQPTRTQAAATITPLIP